MCIPKEKSRGRAATGRYPMIGLRLAPETTAALDKWAANNGLPYRSEATRVLIEAAVGKSAGNA